MPERRKLCPADEIEEGAARGFDLEGDGVDTMFVVRVGGQLTAWRNACPHVGGVPMAWRRDRYLDGEGRRIVCAGHGALFEPESGLCVQGPCLGARLTPAPVEIADGWIHALD